MCHELWSASAIFFLKYLLVVFCFVYFAEWVHSPAHSCSLWEYQRSHVAVKSGCCCGLHCKGECGAIHAQFALWNSFCTGMWEAPLPHQPRGHTWLSCSVTIWCKGAFPGLLNRTWAWDLTSQNFCCHQKELLFSWLQPCKRWAGIQWHKCFHL